MTADTMFLIDRKGVCVDLTVHSNTWFLQRPDHLIGRNLFDLIPSETALALKNNFNKVFATGQPSTDNYELQLGRKTYYFKCIMYRYDADLVLCQYRDITQRILLKQKLEEANKRLYEIKKVAQIGHWYFETGKQLIRYNGLTGSLFEENDYQTFTVHELMNSLHLDDRSLFSDYLAKVQKEFHTEGVTLRFILYGQLHHLLVRAFNSYYDKGIKIIEGYAQDISTIKENQYKLEIITEAVSNSTNCIFAMRKDGQLVFGNRLFYELQGWKPEEDMATHSIFELKNPWFNGKRWYDIIEQVSNRQAVNFILNKPADEQGVMQTFDCTSYMLQDSTRTDLIWTFGKEITERIHYEQQVKELNQIMSTVLNNIPILFRLRTLPMTCDTFSAIKTGAIFAPA
jgi:PAS domain-containing protein